MKKTLLFLVSLCFAFYSCNEEDKVPNRTIFTFTSVSRNPAADYWISIHDNSSGSLIDERQITVDKTPIVFESTKPISNNKIDITIFESVAGSTTGNAGGEVYTGVDVGADWTWPYKAYSPTPPDYGGNAGQYTLEITGVPSLVDFNVSNEFGYLGVSTGAGYTFTAGTITAKPTITGYGHTHLVSLDTGTGKAKYAMVSNPTNGNTVAIDYSTFKEYDRYIHITFPSTAFISSDVYGYEEDAPINRDSYTIQSYRYNPSNPVKVTEWNIGILNSLEKYGIELSILNNFFYASYGPAPESIQYVAPTQYQVSGTTVGDYTVTSSTPFTFRNANYGYSEGNRSITFSYHAPQGYSTKHPDAISSGLAGKYGIDLSKLSYEGTQFNNGRTYDQMLKYLFDGLFDPYSPYSETQVYTSK